MTEPREDRITAVGVHKAFGDNEVLKGVSFTVPRGTSTAIIGPSGSGKTTLLRALNALDKPDAGVIRVGGADGVQRGFQRAVIVRQIGGEVRGLAVPAGPAALGQIEGI